VRELVAAATGRRPELTVAPGRRSRSCWATRCSRPASC